MKEMIQCLENDYRSDEITILGDLNCPNVYYESCESNFLAPRFQNTHHNQDRRLMEFLDDRGYKQIVETKIEYDNVMDDLLTKFSTNFREGSIDDLEKIEHKNDIHDGILIELLNKLDPKCHHFLITRWKKTK